MVELPIPLRYGWKFVQPVRGAVLTIRRSDQGSLDGGVIITPRCRMSAQLESRLAWFRRAANLAREAGIPRDGGRLAELIHSIDDLADDPHDGRERAIAAHMRAQALLVNDRAADAADAFAAAERLWIKARDPRRALVARVGRAEDLQRQGAYADVLDIASRSRLRRDEPDTYFQARLRYAGCVAHASVARFEAAQRCYKEVIASSRRMDERGQVLAASRAYASLLIDMGQLQRAERIGEDIVRTASWPEGSRIRGQANYMLAELALRRGDIASSIRRLEASLDDFTRAAANRWKANAMLVLASLYGELHAFDEAKAHLVAAMGKYRPQDAPSRFAAALLILSDIERDGGSRWVALASAKASEKLFSKLGMAVEVEGARLAQLQILLDLGKVNQVERSIQKVEQRSAGMMPQWRMIDAEIQARLGSPRANETLRQLGREPLSLRDRMRLAELQAIDLRRREGARAAGRTLYETVRAVMNDVARKASRLLDLVARRRLVEARKFGLQLALAEYDGAGSDEESADALVSIWRWVALSSVSTARNGRRAPASTVFATSPALAFDSGDDKTAVSLRRHIVSLLSAAPNLPESPSEPPPTLDAFQSALADGDLYVAYLDMGEDARLLTISRSSAKLWRTISPARLREAAADLDMALAAAIAPTVRPEEAARSLSRALLGSVDERAPERLLIEADGALAALPWPLLTWAGDDRILLERSAIAIARLNEMPAEEGPEPDGVTVVTPGGFEEQGAALSFADAEVRAILQSLADANMTVDVSNGSRASLIEALGHRQWVHIMGHGTTHADHMGYSGVWLQPKDGAPDFFSWIDAIDNGVSADLVVVDACRLGDSGEMSNGNLAFADALSRAGARRVVASKWPMSDAASKTFAQAFYSSLVSDGDAAGALRAAQQQLRGSRAFRDPFYWAGIQMFVRLDTSAARTRVQARGSHRVTPAPRPAPTRR
ncbi:CHAT domain-containing protein [Dokdonella fugitiva]|uniref:CHAT domain-containing protein n=1 Tax=Dokdonella fugitiva TaxID=328517 RepID=UPI0015F9F982|nr:CHAT domain-containing protein [Dokdonella fugitiva]MBA8884741.1 tetratricopeptide (TPR) repeat protein [Dokdonella fugitiva]